MERKDGYFRVKVEASVLEDWKNAAIDMRYMNFSQFVRDAIEEKINRFKQTNYETKLQ